MAEIMIDDATMQAAAQQKINFLKAQIAESRLNVLIYTQINTNYGTNEDAAVLSREADRLARLETAYVVVTGNQVNA